MVVVLHLYRYHCIAANLICANRCKLLAFTLTMALLIISRFGCLHFVVSLTSVGMKKDISYSEVKTLRFNFS